MRKGTHDEIVLTSDSEEDYQGQLTALLNAMPMPDGERLANIGLYATSKTLSRLLFFYEMYQKILQTHGVIMEFGVRWGQTLSIMSALRGIFEPFNRHRKIIGFDTFEGFKGLTQSDGEKCGCKDGSFSVPAGYEAYLDKILHLQEQLNPAGHLRKYELVKGDARVTIPGYFARHPETMVSCAVFDFDIYEPTKAALEAVKPRIFRGSILIFDELCDDVFPGETKALEEVLGFRNLRVLRLPMTSRMSYVEVE